MRKILILSSIAFFTVACSTTLPATEPSTKMMKKADTILLKVEQSPDEAYEGFAQHLSDYGFGFDNTNNKLRLLKTDKQSFDDTKVIGGFSINASIRSTDSTMIHITGNAGLSGAELHNATGFEILIRVLWDKMNDIASDYPHQSVYYKRN